MVSLTIREYSFFALSLLAAVWFFVAYPSQDPRSIADLNVDRNTIEQKAGDWLESLGHSAQNYEIKSTFLANRRLLDSLQTNLGRSEIIEYQTVFLAGTTAVPGQQESATGSTREPGFTSTT